MIEKRVALRTESRNIPTTELKIKNKNNRLWGGITKEVGENSHESGVLKGMLKRREERKS